MKKLLKNKQLLGIYTLWLALHFILFVISWSGEDDRMFFPTAQEQVWPISSLSVVYSYDYTEFLIYTVTPALVIIAITLINTKEDE